jgi:hypothetical protein
MDVFEITRRGQAARTSGQKMNAAVTRQGLKGSIDMIPEYSFSADREFSRVSCQHIDGGYAAISYPFVTI